MIKSEHDLEGSGDSGDSGCNKSKLCLNGFKMWRGEMQSHTDFAQIFY